MNLPIRTNPTPCCLDFYVVNIKPCMYFVVQWVGLRVLHVLAKLHPQPTLKCSVHLSSQQLSLRSCRRPYRQSF